MTRHCEGAEGRRTNPESLARRPGLLRFRLRAPRFGGLKPAVARAASEGGSLATTRTKLFIDRGGAGHAAHLVLRAGAARAADRADDLAVLDQRNSAARADHVVQRHEVVEPGLLYALLEHLGRPAILRRRARLVLGD